MPEQFVKKPFFAIIFLMIQKNLLILFFLLSFTSGCGLKINKSALLKNKNTNTEKTLSNLEEKTEENPQSKKIREIETFFDFYPDLEYQTEYDSSLEDWKITIKAKVFLNRKDKSDEYKTLTKEAVFYWADGRLLPESELSRKDDYWLLQYHYSNRLRDPASYSEEEIENIRKFGSTSSRKNTEGSPMFFFDFIYAAKSRAVIEEHIIRTKFLGKTTKVHERVLPALKRVEAEICLLAAISVESLTPEKISAMDTNSEKLTSEQKEIRLFIKNLRSADAYFWREIAGTKRKSFHSYGIAIDLLPRKLNGRSIFWAWEKERSGDQWMMTPPESRWSPPESVIRLFEKNGFIWGGYWIIYDNMHFEYHPELTGMLSLEE